LPLFIKYRQDMQSLKPIYFVISHNVPQDLLIQPQFKAPSCCLDVYICNVSK